MENGKGCKYDNQCTSGICTNGFCKAKSLVGKTCDFSGDDKSCADSKACGQEGVGQFKCCKSLAPSVGFEIRTDDWCAELDNGKGCKYDNQCTSGMCQNGICTAKGLIGQKCSSNGDDKSCSVGICAQYAATDYHCCSSIASGWFDEWCNNLPDGTGCKHDNQCNSKFCGDNICHTPLTSCPGYNCAGKNGQYCNSNGNWRCDNGTWVSL